MSSNAEVEVFDNIKRSMMIEKGYVLWQQEVGIDLKALISKLPQAQTSTFRNGLREMQEKMGLEQHDLAIMMVTPFLEFMDFTTQGDIHTAIKQWYQNGTVQPDVFKFYKSKVTHPMLQ